MTQDTTPPGETVLFVDDEAHLRHAAEQTLGLADLEVTCFADAEAALTRINRHFEGVLVSDIRMVPMDGLALMRRALELDPELPIILVTGHGDVELAVSAMRDGAYDFLEKPYSPARLVTAVRRALDKRRLTIENRALRREVTQGDVVEARVTGRSDAMVALRRQLRAVAQTDADALIYGETGTGKDVVAHALHRASARHAGPFVHINCAALPEALIESELFGHEVGAYAGATRARYGKFEHGRGGTVFLDEIDSLPLPLQAKLLHAVQNRTNTRLGSNDTIPLDVRFLAAAKTDLTEAAAEGRFRADLLYRLNVVSLRLPRLDERREDIPQLFSQLVQQSAARYKRAVPEVPGPLLNSLGARHWPGNVRELRNAADRFVLGLDLGQDVAHPHSAPQGSLADQMAAHEKAVIAAQLTAHHGSLKETYEGLGLSRKALYEKMQKHGLSREDFAGD